MDLWTLDFETYYGDDYTLSKMTTEAYVRDPRFEIILCAFQKNDEEPYWIDGPEVIEHIQSLGLDSCAVLAHHAHFDGLILSHHCGVKPKLWFDSLSMARVLYGGKGGLSLAKLCERHGLKAKGEEVLQARGMRRRDFSPGFLRKYGAYSCNDAGRTYELWEIMSPHFGTEEIKLIDRTIRMFTEPVLEADVKLLQEYLITTRAEKNMALVRAGLQKTDVMSNDKFAAALEALGIEPPMKVSPKAGKPHPKFGLINKKTGQLALDPKTKQPYPQVYPHVLTYAFAKTDEAMQELAEHVNEDVQALVAARLKNKSTINETRAQRIIEMAERGKLCLYVKHAGADQTMRASGGDKMNWQNMTRGSVLRQAVMAPRGQVCVVGDSSTIEARMNDWLWGQDDLVQAYRLYDAGKGPDIYCVMAQMIYGYEVNKKTHPDERQMGKVSKLGLGYGMGDKKFPFVVRAQAKDKNGKPLIIKPDFSRFVVQTYRTNHAKVVEGWELCNQALWKIYKGIEDVGVDPRGIVRTGKEGLRLPNGLIIKYPKLKYAEDPETGKMQFTYFNGKTRERIYGAKVCENIIQALARIVVMYQCVMVPKKCRWSLTVHDEGLWVVPERYAEATVEAVTECLRTPLAWCKSLPLNCGVGFNRRYGDAKT